MKLSISELATTETLTPKRILKPPLVLVISGLLLLGVFLLDKQTGDAPSQHLYYIPIAVLAINFGFAGGLFGATASIVLYHLANMPVLTFAYAEADFVRIFVFLIVGLVIAKMSDDSRKLRQLAATDDLTGLHNLRSFEARLRNMVHTTRARTGVMSVIVLDVDRLKSINDRHGHLAGAEAVRLVGSVIAETIPGDAVGCRYGGDEFVIAIGNCDDSRAEALANELRMKVRTSEPVLAGQPFPLGSLTISLGVATKYFDGKTQSTRSAMIRDNEDGTELFLSADKQLYAAKTAGKDRISTALLSDGPVSQ